MVNQVFLKSIWYSCIITLLAVGALANFYRNRDPYKAYFHARSDHYLTTHILDSDLNRNSCLEYRMSGKATSQFFQAIHELYRDKVLVVPNDFFFDLNTLSLNTAKNILLQDKQLLLSEKNIYSLLRQGKYSFFYSPLLFSPLKGNVPVFRREKHVDPCMTYESPWEKGTFPLLIVLMPVRSPDEHSIHVVHRDKYLFFIPSEYPELENHQ